MIGASPGSFGGVWAQAETRKVLGLMGSRVVGAELSLGKAHERLVEPDAELVEQLRAVIELLVDEAARAPRRPSTEARLTPRAAPRARRRRRGRPRRRGRTSRPAPPPGVVRVRRDEDVPSGAELDRVAVDRERAAARDAVVDLLLPGLQLVVLGPALPGGKSI